MGLEAGAALLSDIFGGAEAATAVGAGELAAGAGGLGLTTEGASLASLGLGGAESAGMGALASGAADTAAAVAGAGATAGELTAADIALTPAAGTTAAASTAGATAADVAAFQGMGATGAELAGAAAGTAGLEAGTAPLLSSAADVASSVNTIAPAVASMETAATPAADIVASAAPDAGWTLGFDLPMGAAPSSFIAPATSAVDTFSTDAAAPALDESAAETARNASLEEQLANAPSSMATNASVMGALKQLGAVGNAVLPWAALGLNKNQQGKTQSAAGDLNAIAKPVSDTSNALLAQYKSGQLNPQDQFKIAQWAQQQKAALNQYYQNAGLGNSSMHVDALSKIDAQAEAMRGQAVQNLLTGGLNAAGIAQGPQMAAVQASVSADQKMQQATSNFMAALAKMNTVQSAQSGAPS